MRARSNYEAKSHSTAANHATTRARRNSHHSAEYCTFDRCIQLPAKLNRRKSTWRYIHGICVPGFHSAMGDQRVRLHQGSASTVSVAVEAPKLLRHLKTDQLEAFKFQFENADAARKYSVSAPGTVSYYSSRATTHKKIFLNSTFASPLHILSSLASTLSLFCSSLKGCMKTASYVDQPTDFSEGLTQLTVQTSFCNTHP